MDSKSIFASKTFWTAILSPVVGYIGGKLLHLPPESVTTIAETLATVAPVFISLRYVSDSAVHVLPK